MIPNYDDKLLSGEGGAMNSTHNDAVIVRILSRELSPEVSKLCIGRTTLSDDLTIPTSVVVLIAYC